MGRRPMCLVCLLLMLLLFLLDLAGFDFIRENPLSQAIRQELACNPQVTAVGEVVRCVDTDNSHSVYLRQVSLICRSEKIPIKNLRVYFKEKTRVPAGTLILVSGKIEETAGARNPGEFDRKDYYAAQGIYYIMKEAKLRRVSSFHSVPGQMLADLREKLLESMEVGAGEDAPLFEAMLLGARQHLDPETRLRYQSAGILHILAISGLHVSMLGMGVQKICLLCGAGLYSSCFLALLVMVPYGVLTGESVSVIRAVCMFLLSAGARILGRCYDPLTALALAAILLLLERPACLFDSSFLLSFCAVLGTSAVAPVLKAFFGNAGNVNFAAFTGGEEAKTAVRVRNYSENKNWLDLSDPFMTMLGVQLMTLPVQLFVYGEVSLSGLMLNLVVLPGMGVVLGSGIAGGVTGLVGILGAELNWRQTAAGIQSLARGLFLPGRFLLHVFELLCEWFARMPFGTWTAGCPGWKKTVLYYMILGMAVCGMAVLSDGSGEMRQDFFFAFTGKGLWTRFRESTPNMQKSLLLIRRRLPPMQKPLLLLRRCLLPMRKSLFTIRSLLLPMRKSVFVILLLGNCILLGVHPAGKLRITCLDVGQGDGIVVETPEHQCILIDGGSSDKKEVGKNILLPFLKYRGYSILDAVFVSHTDDDHISGILELMELMKKNLISLQIRVLMLPEWSVHSENYEKLIYLAKENRIRVVYVKQGDSMKLDGLDVQVLAPKQGAAGEDGNNDSQVLFLRYGEFDGLFTGDIGTETEKILLPLLPDVDFLKTAHHGSRYSTGEAFLEKTKPELAVISCSEKNRYGHPAVETIRRLADAGVQTEYTMKSGAVTIETDGKRIWVERFCN